MAYELAEVKHSVAAADDDGNIQSKGKEKGLGLVFVFGQCDSMDLVLMFEMFGCLL